MPCVNASLLEGLHGEISTRMTSDLAATLPSCSLMQCQVSCMCHSYLSPPSPFPLRCRQPNLVEDKREVFVRNVRLLGLGAPLGREGEEVGSASSTGGAGNQQQLHVGYLRTCVSMGRKG